MADPQQQQYQQPQMQQQPPMQQQQMQQPMQQNTTVIIQQPAGNAQGYPQNVREWNSGLFGCFDDCMGCKLSTTIRERN